MTLQDADPGSPTTITKEYYEQVVERERLLDADYAAQRVALKLGKLRQPSPGDAILDVGCGTGVITAAFARMGLRASGIDVVPEFVALARQTHPDVEFLVAEAESLPFPDEQFDFLNLSSLLEHVEDWRRTLSEAARVLKPGGVLYLRTSNRLWPLQSEIRYFPGFGYLPAPLQRRIYSLAMKHRPSLVGHTHLPAYHWLTYWQIARELRRHGLESFSWPRLVDPEDIPHRLRKLSRLIMLVRRSRLPLFALTPAANIIVARKGGS